MSSITQRIALISSISATLLLLVLRITVMSQSPEPAKRRNPEAYLPLPRLETGEGREQVLPSGVCDYPLCWWSTMVYQSYRDGNWDIYFIGEPSRRDPLSPHPRSDIHPRLNRGATRIVFASDRDGDDFEIYSMNVDGTELFQLTDNATDDVRPTWSPDSSKVAFEAYRDGQPEIYVMSAYGQDPRRLTYDSDYDGMPDWSPDGTKLAFVSRRTGGYRIYTMTVDGNNLVMLSNQPYSLRPVWSPDSQRLAYDADMDGDGWQDLWVMDSDGMGQRMLHSPAGQKDAWASSWSPDGAYVAFTEISFVLYNNRWYWTEAFNNSWSFEYDSTIRLYWRDRDWLLDWKTVDAVPPQSRLADLPLYARSDIQVSWSGYDLGIMGVKHYDVQFSESGSAVWIDWLVGTTAKSANFTGVSGKVYSFRVRGTDNAGNVGEWSTGAGNSIVTFYSWSISGTISSNTDTPVMLATGSTDPASFIVVPSDLSGTYSNYVGTQAGSYGASWSKPGYGILPATSFSPDDDASFDLVLPPADNVVLDSGFESGFSSSTPWMHSGITSSVTTTVGHTGQSSAFLGHSRTENPLKVSASPPNSGNAVQRIGPDGRVHLVWTTFDVQQGSDLFYASKAPNGLWSSPLNLSNTPSREFTIDLEVDHLGSPHVVWTGQVSWNTYAGYYATLPISGTWSSPLKLSGDNVINPEPQLALSSDGEVHAVWTQGYPVAQVYYAERSGDGIWSEPKNISNTPGASSDARIAVSSTDEAVVIWKERATGRIFTSHSDSSGVWSSPAQFPSIYDYAQDLQIAIDGSGDGHLVWSGPKGVYRVIYYATAPQGGSWAVPFDISTSDRNARAPSLDVDQNRNVHFVWLEGDDIIYAKRSNSGIFHPQVVVGSSPREIDGPIVAVDHMGGAHVIWRQRDSDDTYDLYYTFVGANGTVPTPLNATTGIDIGVESINLAIGLENSVHLAWNTSKNSHPDGDVYHQEFRPSVATLTQVVSMSESLKDPVLSFYYQLDAGSVNGISLLNVHIGDGFLSETLFSASSGRPVWSHEWADLSHWTGRNVTLTLELNVLNPATWASFDEVTIGSAHTDVWVEVDGADEVLPGETLVYTLTFGNRSPIAARDVAITASLPAEIGYVAGSLLPAAIEPDPVWIFPHFSNVSDPHVITFTAMLSPTAPSLVPYMTAATISTSAPELEIENNFAETGFFAGRLVYLPILSR